MQTWYWEKNEEDESSISERLSDLGSQGWELVSVTSSSKGTGWSGWTGTTDTVGFYFKRAIKD